MHVAHNQVISTQPEGTPVEKAGHWPSIAKVHIKGIISLSPDSLIFPSLDNHKIIEMSGFLMSINLSVLDYVYFLAKTHTSWLLPNFGAVLRATI